jgi:hypothetical protein
MIPNSDATAIAPDFAIKFSSLHVNPDKKYRTGTFFLDCSIACGGTYTEKFIALWQHADS